MNTDEKLVNPAGVDEYRRSVPEKRRKWRRLVRRRLVQVHRRRVDRALVELKHP